VTAPVLEVEDLRVDLRTPRGTAHVVNGLSYTVGHGETVAIVGESGSGKSVSVLALLGLLPARTATVTGRALLHGEDLLTMRSDRLREVRGPGVGMVFQDPMTSLNPVLTVGRQLVEGIRAHGDVSKTAARARAVELLAEVGLPDPARAVDRYPHELSGGMKQRVAIARSLAYDPGVLLMDEPFAALDAQTRDSLQDELLRIWAKTGKTVVFITHGIDEAVYLGGRVAVLTSRPGRVKEVVDVNLGARDEQEDLRSSPEFAAHRHRVWSLLKDEVQTAQRLTVPAPRKEAIHLG
jgi:peptide/nickel transport system ATP-binding protein